MTSGSNTGSNAEIDRPPVTGHDESLQRTDRALNPPTRITRDPGLVRRLLARDNDAWQEFIRRYERLVYRIVYATAAELQFVPLSDDRIEDVCAEVFGTLIQRDMAALRQFSGRSKLSTWLAVVTRRIALRSLYRQMKSARQADSTEIAALTATGDEAARRKSGRLSKLRDGLRKLSYDDQRVLALFYERQLSYQQIAEHLGISANAVGPKLDRARRRLRTALNNTPTPYQEFDFLSGAADE